MRESAFTHSGRCVCACTLAYLFKNFTRVDLRPKAGAQITHSKVSDAYSNESVHVESNSVAHSSNLMVPSFSKNESKLLKALYVVLSMQLVVLRPETEPRLRAPRTRFNFIHNRGT